MIIKNLKLIGFRNLENFQVSFSKNKNLIYGLNGAGKTSILEAIFLPGFGKSFLNVKKSEIVNDHANFFSIRLSAVDHHNDGHNNDGYDNNGHDNNISAHYDKDKGKFTLLLNEKKSNIFEINKYLYPLLFSSSNYNLYIESKTHIRKLMDRFMFGIDSLYIHYLLSYNKALKQKNYLLKTKKNLDELSSWNKILSEMSEKVVGTRMKFIETLNTEIKNKFNRDLAITYRSSFAPISNTPDAADISQRFFFTQLEKLKQSEIIQKRSLRGVHLDRFDIRLNRKDLKFYSSGEKKINLLMLYIAFIQFFKRLKNEYPIFLVDDFDTAIDERNIDFLIENYPDLQVIATSVKKNDRFDRLIELRKEI
ncbi:MAG TPA: AAA family ATPase [Candidatus Kapabacteria bacterium]|nr:AAA family ATPase [Candidatus Kapabacteria bacterium]